MRVKPFYLKPFVFLVPRIRVYENVFMELHIGKAHDFPTYYENTII